MTTQRPVNSAVSRPARSLLALALLVGGCGGNESSSSPSPTTPTPASPQYTTTFAGTLPVRGARFFSFSMATQGTIDATLEEVGGPGVDPNVVVDLAIGQPAGVSCSGSRTPVQANGEGSVPRKVSSVQPSGTYCVLIADPGNLPAPATFRVSIAHP